MTKYALQIGLLPHQMRFFSLIDRPNPCPFPLLVGGFGCGKTYTVVAAAIHLQIKYPGIRGAIFEPTYGDIRDIILPELTLFCENNGIAYSYNGQSSKFRTQFGEIYLKSMHEPEKIKGFQVGWALVDEIDTMKPDKAEMAWDKIIARARIPLSDGRPNIVGAATTPEGFGFVYKRWVEEDKEGYERVHGKTKTALNAGFISSAYVQNLIGSYTVELQKAYLEGEFVNLRTASFYYGFSSDHIRPVEIDLSLPLNLCFDFNVDPGVAVIAQDRGKGDIRAIREVYIGNANTGIVCQNIKNEIGELGKELDVVIYGDASGQSRDTRSNLSDYRIIKHELEPFFRSFKFAIPSKNPSIKDRDNSVNKALQDNAVSISPHCKALIRDFRQVTRKGNDIDKSDPKLTHISDAIGYYITQKYPIYRERIHKPARAL